MVRPGQVIGQRYEILDRIAAGGMGSVYRAQHVLSRQTVALKLIHPEVAMDRAGVTRFKNEASVRSKIGHDGIVQVLDAGVDAEQGFLFLAMELLVGENLRKRLSRADTTRAAAVELLLGMLEPLAAAHRQRFIHRDLKPENVFVVRATAERPEQVKLLDFGIAKDLGADTRVTQTGAALGTPHYMAPEQIMGVRHMTPAADCWAVGVMLWEVLTGRNPFEGETPHAVVVKACTHTPPPVRELADDVGPRLSALIHACLDKEPTRRPQDAGELRERLLEALASDPELATRPVTIAPPPSREVAPTEILDAPTAAVHAPTRRTPLTAPRDEWKRVSGKGWSFEVPPTWVEEQTLVPMVVAQYAAPEPVEGLVPSVRLKMEFFDGDTRSYADLGLENMAASATIHRTADAPFGGTPALEVEATVHTADPPFRSLTRCAVEGGVGRVAVGKGPVLGFGTVAPILRAILGSFRFDPAGD